jgi:hypothetical protein
MVKKIVLALVMFVGLIAAPRPALAEGGCATDLADCYTAAAKVDSFWYRWAAGLDCELDFTECVRLKVIGR